MESCKILIKKMIVGMQNCTQRYRESDPLAFYSQQVAEVRAVLLHNLGLALGR